MDNKLPDRKAAGVGGHFWQNLRNNWNLQIIHIQIERKSFNIVANKFLNTRYCDWDFELTFETTILKTKGGDSVDNRKSIIA